MRAVLLGLLAAGALAVAGCGDGHARFTGMVAWHDPGMAIGGEADPAGYVLAGDHREAVRRHLADAPPEERQRVGYDDGTLFRGPGWDRLYLRLEGSLDHPRLKALDDERVTVRGTFDLLHAGGVETPARKFLVLDVSEIEPAE